MEPTSSGRQDWDEASFRGIMQRYLPENTPLFGSFYSFGFAIHHDETLKAQQFFNELLKKFRFSGFYRRLLLCGAGASCPLVRHVVEILKVSINDVLNDSMYRSDHGENALHIAIENNRNDVVDYLLKDWAQVPLNVLEVTSFFVPSHILRGNLLHFDSSEYFEKLYEALPDDFSTTKNDDKNIWYFLQRMTGQGRQFQTGNKISPDTSEEALRVIEKDNQFLFTCLRVQDFGYLSPLLEIYGHEPKLFHSMADWAMSVDAFIFFNEELLESRRGSGSGGNFEAVLKSWLKSRQPKLVHTAGFLRILQQDWNSMRHVWSSCELKGTLSFSKGLDLVCKRLHQRVVREEAKAAVDMMSELSQKTGASLSTNKPRNMTRRDFTCHYLLASAGSGKTQRLMDWLSVRYGFYFSSGAIEDNPTVSNDGEALYQPKTLGSSQDTKLLFNTTKVPWLRSGSLNYGSLASRCCSLLFSRLALLMWVRELSWKSTSSFTLTPQSWLQFQLSCNSDQDSFLRLSRLSMITKFDLKNSPSLEGLTEASIKEVRAMKLLWCFDEVQCDLSSMWLNDDRTAGTTMLECLIYGLRVLDPGEKNVPALSHIFLSGTALNIDKVKAVLHNSDRIFTSGGIFDSDMIQSPEKSFPLVTDNKEFTKVFNRRVADILNILSDPRSSKESVPNTNCSGAVFIPANDRTWSGLFEHFQAYRGQRGKDKPIEITEEISRTFKAFEPQILQQSILFRGRYRWSVYYVEKLLERFFLDRKISDQNIREVADEAKRILKAPIKRRLQDLAQMPEKSSMMDDVFNMALDADLFGRSRILCSKSSAELIEQALGYVEEAESEGVDAVKVCLAERLVVDSVMEHLEDTGNLETLVDNYLYAHQFYEGALGDAAEFGLAASVNRLSSQTLPQREEFVSAFDNVYKISATDCAFNRKLNLANFVLEKGGGLRRDYMPADVKDWGLIRWLELVREKKPRPTFLFPEQVAGPDLMFVYKEKDGAKRIVFAIQLKTGRDNASSDKVMKTMDPDRWFSSDPELKERFQGELQLCNNAPTISFFSVLFLAGKKMKATSKYRGALDYMEKRVAISSEWKSEFQEALKEVEIAESHSKIRPTDEAAEELRTAELNLRRKLDEFPNEQSRKPAVNLLAESTNSTKPVPEQSPSIGKLLWIVWRLIITVPRALISTLWGIWANPPRKDLDKEIPTVNPPRKDLDKEIPTVNPPRKDLDKEIPTVNPPREDLDKEISTANPLREDLDKEISTANPLREDLDKEISTDYYFQILADESAEKIFGCVFARLLGAIKTGIPFRFRPINSVLGHATHSNGSPASGGAQNDGNESGNTADDGGGQNDGNQSGNASEVDGDDMGNLFDGNTSEIDEVFGNFFGGQNGGNNGNTSEADGDEDIGDLSRQIDDENEAGNTSETDGDEPDDYEDLYRPRKKFPMEGPWEVGLGKPIKMTLVRKHDKLGG